VPTGHAIFAGTITQTTIATIKTPAPATTDWVGVVLEVTAVSGAGACAQFSLQWSMDGGVWADAIPADTFVPITAPTVIVQRFEAKAAYYRAVCQLTGTDPSFTGTANSYS
jgi:hypothetical protein